MDKLNVVIMGVGGQGTLLASRILGSLAQDLGLDVKVSEVHGMSQRGGSVTTYVRMGKTVHAALIEQKGADFVLAFEELEALRALPYLAEGGTMVVNTRQTLPMPVITGATEYPQDILPALKKAAGRVEAVDALPLAAEAGTEKAVNVVLLGVLASLLPLDKKYWISALEANVHERFRKANLAAFELGYAHCHS